MANETKKNPQVIQYLGAIIRVNQNLYEEQGKRDEDIKFIEDFETEYPGLKLVRPKFTEEIQEEVSGDAETYESEVDE